MDPSNTPAIDSGSMEEYLQIVGGPVGALGLAVVAAGSLAYLASRPTPFNVAMDLESQSLPLKGAENVRISRLCKDGRFVQFMYEDTRTLHAVFQRGARMSGPNNCLGWRETPTAPYQWISYDRTIQRMKNFGSGLIAKGLKPHPTTFVGIYAQNCPEWVISEYGLYMFNMVVVPLYDTLGSEACAFIINQAEINTVICDTEDKIKLLLKESGNSSTLKLIIHMKTVSEEVSRDAKAKNVELLSYAELERLGENQPHDPVPPKPEDLATICYTSGTTGNPKGVMLTHENVVSDVSAVCLQMGDIRPAKSDTMISFLPLAHMLERCCEVGVYVEGGAMGFFSGDIRNLADDMKALRPTITPAVPRLLNRIYDKTMQMVESSLIKKTLLKMALSSKESEIKRSVIRNNSIWDKIVFKKVQEGMGGRVRMLVVGSAPLAANVLTFIRCALGCVVLEGYGQTECVAPCTLTVPGDWTPEHVGPPIPCNAIKLVDVPEMEYWASENMGEVCIKGINVSQGYFKDPEKTKDTFDSDGWLHTGDIGQWLDNGSLKIVDRKKHIFKLSQGEYIAPEKIENIYIRSTLVSQIFVHGESLKSCLVAVVVPDPETLKKWGPEKGVNGTMEEMCENATLKKAILEDLTSLGKKAGLKSFEQVKDIYLSPEAFTVENNLLTPTLKTKRPELKKFFIKQIEAMYQTLV